MRNRYKARPDPNLARAILLSLGASRQPQSADFLLEVIADSEFEHAIDAQKALAASRFHEDYRDRVADAIRRRADASRFADVPL